MRFLLSIVVPIYNVEDYLEECLKSLSEITDERIEIILINDGSTDNSESIAKENLKSNWKYISQKNSGLSAARNTGYKVAEGQYIYYLDSDDYIDVEELGELTHHLDGTLDILGFSKCDFKDGEQRGINTIVPNVMKKASGIEVLELLLSKRKYQSSVCNYIFNMTFLKDNKLTFYDGIIHEDELFTAKAFLLATSVQLSNGVFYYRRLRENSIMSSRNYEKSFVGYSTCIKEILIFSSKKDIELLAYLSRLNIICIEMNKAYYYMEKDERKVFYQQKKNVENKLLESSVYTLFDIVYLNLYAFLSTHFPLRVKEYLKRIKNKGE